MIATLRRAANGALSQRKEGALRAERVVLLLQLLRSIAVIGVLDDAVGRAYQLALRLVVTKPRNIVFFTSPPPRFKMAIYRSCKIAAKFASL